MKTIKNIRSITIALMTLMLVSACETEFFNPNAPTESQVLSSREGLVALSVGIKQLYSTTGLRWIIETPAITAREGGITTTFQNMIELEEGGADLPNFNSNVSGMWATLLRVMVMSDNLIESAAEVDLGSDTRNTFIAFGSFFKALSIGALSQHYEQVIVQPSQNNDASFVSQAQGYQTAITLLETAKSSLSGASIPSDFSSNVLGGLDMLNSVNAMLARFNLFAGNYDAAISAAQAVNLNVASVWEYDVQSQNPVWSRVFQNNAPNFKPRDNFGLPTDIFSFNPNDGRLAFYLVPLDQDNQNNLPIEDLAGFFTSPTGSMPVYLPGEMSLVIAEANVRKASPDLNAAVAALNAVKTKTDDPFGVNANVGEYDGPLTADDILLEIYKNRRAELFLTGLSLEDSRRFNRPQPSPQPLMFSDERNRNFYPYPERERNNNPNTPSDPSI